MSKFGSFIWAGALLTIILFLVFPFTHNLFSTATSAHPFLMGFVKFAILSIMGEFLAIRIVNKKWIMVKGLPYKMAIWGILGATIVLMFSLYSAGVSGSIDKGFLFVGSGGIASILKALYISSIMNLTFGPVFMAVHRITDVYIDSRIDGNRIGLSQIVSKIDWPGFMKFVVGKTIPLFWIPAHTITFLLPDEYKVLFAASLSIILGLILSYAKLKK